MQDLQTQIKTLQTELDNAQFALQETPEYEQVQFLEKELKAAQDKLAERKRAAGISKLTENGYEIRKLLTN
jgi:hypothetical protein